MKKRPLTLKLLALVILTDLLETIVQFCFKKSALPFENTTISSAKEALSFAYTIAQSPLLWIGLLTVLILFSIWVLILSKVDLSVAVPVASFSYIAIPLVSVFILGEHIPPLRWMGIVFILLGVCLVSWSSYRQESLS